MPDARGAGSWTPTVSVIVPAFNEARNLPHVLGGLPDGLHEVILVDGRSVDDTVEVARRCRPDIRIVQQTRRGKGNAMACGFAAATGDVIVMLDADGSADPKEIDAFVGALVAGADFAKGTRFAAGGGSHDITHFRRWGNRWLNRVVNVLFGAEYTDLCYGYNAFWSRLLPLLDLPPLEIDGAGEGDMLWGDGFEIETLINIRMVEAGVKITEVGSVELNRLHGESNLNAIPDGLRVLRTALHERRHRARRDAERAAIRERHRDILAGAKHRILINLTDSTRVPTASMIDADGTEIELNPGGVAAPGLAGGGSSVGN